MAQVYFDDVKEGQDIPTLEKTPTTQDSGHVGRSFR